MTTKVIQGVFLGGRPRLPGPAVQPKVGHLAMPRPPGPPVPAFAGRAPLAPAQTVQPCGGGESFTVAPAQLGLVGGGGTPLPEAVRGRMEAALGADFSTVRVHVGPQAERIGAVAFTTGSDIYFAPGRFQPDTTQGRHLLGHELVHVLQQRQGRVRAPCGVGVAVVQDRALEAEADRLGWRAAAQNSKSASALPLSAASASGPPHSSAVQRMKTKIGGRTLDVSHPGTNGKKLGRANSIQLHPLTIKIAGFKDWTRDADDINFANDLELFESKINPNNPKVISIEVRKKNLEDHHVLVVGTNDGKFTQMDIASGGAILRYGINRNYYSIVTDAYTPKSGITLHDAFRVFYLKTKERGFDFTDYNCIRFANDVAGKLGTCDTNDFGW